MSTINITNARKDLYNLVENVNRYSEPILIVGKREMQCLYLKTTGMPYKRPCI